MAVPKKKTSRARKGLRRAGQHHKRFRKDVFACAICGATVLPHRVCSSCGHYKGKEFVTVKAAQEEGAQETAE